MTHETMTPLMHAAWNGALSEIDLLARTCDVNKRGDVELWSACEPDGGVKHVPALSCARDAPTIKLLLLYGARVCDISLCGTAVFRSDDADGVAALIDSGADAAPRANKRHCLWPLMFCAVKCDKLHIAEMLLRKGLAFLDWQGFDADGVWQTVAHAAVSTPNASLRMLRLLHRAKVDFAAVCPERRLLTANLHHPLYCADAIAVAAMRLKPALMAYLIAAGGTRLSHEPYAYAQAAYTPSNKRHGLVYMSFLSSDNLYFTDLMHEAIERALLLLASGSFPDSLDVFQSAAFGPLMSYNFDGAIADEWKVLCAAREFVARSPGSTGSADDQVGRAAIEAHRKILAQVYWCEFMRAALCELAIALHTLDVAAPLIVAIADRSEPHARLIARHIPYHLKWRAVCCVKHFVV